MEPVSGTSSSSSESASPLSTPKFCPVCMRKLKKCELGKPDTCNHVFCFTCLYEWSKNVNTCPVDRVKFNIIEVFDIDRKCSRQVDVEDHNLDQVLVDPYGLTYCEVCGQCTREGRLLLCDGCDKGYHTNCLVPKLKKVPTGNWYCKHCEPIVRGVLVSGDTVDDSSSESEQEDIIVLEGKQPELPKSSSALAAEDSKEAASSIDEEDMKDFEKSSSSSSHSSSVASQAQSSTSSNDSDVDFMTSRNQHSKSSMGSDKQHIVLKRGGYLVNKQKRKHKKLNLERGQDSPIDNKIREFDFLSSGSSSRGARVPSSPMSRARTVATGGQAPSISIRQAVIASHRCSSSQDGLVAAQRIAQGVWQAPGVSTVRQKRPKAYQRSQNLTVPMRYCTVMLDKLPIEKSSSSPRLASSRSNVLHSSPTHDQPIDLTISSTRRPISEEQKFSRPSTTDYVGAICQGLDNLQAKEHIFHRDGSIEAVQPKIHVPIRSRKKVTLEMARYSQENEDSRSQYIRAHSKDLPSHGHSCNTQVSHSSLQSVRAYGDTSDSWTPNSLPQDAQAASFCAQDVQVFSSLSQAPNSPPQNIKASSSCPLARVSSQSTPFHSFNSKNFYCLQVPTSDDQDPSVHYNQAPSFQEQNSSPYVQSVAIESSKEEATGHITESTFRNLGTTSEKVSKPIKKCNNRARRRRRRRREQIGLPKHFKPQSIWQQDQLAQSKPLLSRQQKDSQQFKPQTQQSRCDQSKQLKDHFPSLTPTATTSSVSLNLPNTAPQMYQTPLSTLAEKKAIPCVPLFPELSNRVHIKQEPRPISPEQNLFSQPQDNSLDQLCSSDCFLDSPSRPQPLFSPFYSDQCEDKKFLHQSLIKSKPSEINFTPFHTQMLIKSEPSSDIEPSLEHRYMCEVPSSLDFHYPEPSERQYQEVDSAYQCEEQSHYSTPAHYPPTEYENQLPSLRALFPRSCHSPQQSMDCSDWLDAVADQNQMELNCPAIMADTAHSPSDMCLSSPNHFYKSFWQFSSDSPTVEPATQSVAVDQMDDSEAEHYYASHKLKIESFFRCSFFHEQKDTTPSDESIYTPVYPVESMNWSSPIPTSRHETNRSRSKNNGNLLNCQLAGEYVIQLLEHYRQKGYIPEEHVYRITEKALRKVQTTKNLVPEARVKKLVDDYVAIYTSTTCPT